MIDMAEFTVDVYVTHDDKFKKQIVLGKELWEPLPMLATPMKEKKLQEARVVIGSLDLSDSARHPLNNQFEAVVLLAGTRNRALIDTGAAVSVMEKSTYLSIGGQLENLEKTDLTLVNASKDRMKTLGLTPPLPFELGDQIYWLRFASSRTIVW